MTDKNKREHIRTKLRAEVKLSHPEFGDLTLRTGDISDGGAYVYAGDHPMPAMGEIISMQVQGMGSGEAPVVKMKVMRIDKNGIGLAFVDDE